MPGKYAKELERKIVSCNLISKNESEEKIDDLKILFPKNSKSLWAKFTFKDRSYRIYDPFNNLTFSNR